MLEPASQSEAVQGGGEPRVVWRLRAGELDPQRHRRAGYRLAAWLGLHPVLGQVLVARGMGEPESARAYLRPGAPPDPWRLPGVAAAAWRMWRAVRRGEPVVVYGDYDADGQTSAAIMLRALRHLGAQAQAFIPHRLSLGYGLHEEVLVEMARAGVGLVVAVDCGISATSAVRRACEQGLDVVVVDHHEAPARLPPAVAVVAAHQLVDWLGAAEMSAAGLAYHTARALLELAGARDGEEELAQLAAVGTIADVVPLVGENRRLVQQGLQAMRHNALPGLAALAQVAGLELSRIDSHHVAFILAPRLNAAGRVDDAMVGLRLLLEEDPQQAEQLARRLEQANRVRQQTEQKVLEQALQQAEQRLAERDWPVVVVAGEGWHPGVIGIVASRLVERYGRPAVVISLDDDQARGSARSVEGVDIHRLLGGLRRHFLRFGGHPMAAGFSLPPQRAGAFIEELLEHACREYPVPPPPVLELDGWVTLDELDRLLGEQLRLLEPHGEGNPRPLLGAGGVKLVQWRPVGADGRHLRVVVEDPVSGQQKAAVAFDQAARWLPAIQAWGTGSWVELAFVPREGRYGELELQLVDVRPLPGERVWVGAPPAAGDSASGRGFPSAAKRADAAGKPTAAPPEAGAGAAGEQPAIHDCRGLADRGVRELAFRLAEAGVAGGSGPWVVVVRDELRAREWAWQWWQENLDSRWPVCWGVPAPGGGAASLLQPPSVCVGWDWRDFEVGAVLRGATVIFWDLPQDAAAWARTCLRSGAQAVVLAFGEAAIQELQEKLDELPDVGTLRNLYRWLRAQVAVAGPRLGDVATLARCLALLCEGKAAVPERMLQAALEVFEELGLVVRGEGRGWIWRGVPAGRKLDLASSERYNELIRARAYWSEYLRAVRESTGVALWRLWSDGGGFGESG